MGVGLLPESSLWLSPFQGVLVPMKESEVLHQNSLKSWKWPPVCGVGPVIVDTRFLCPQKEPQLYRFTQEEGPLGNQELLIYLKIQPSFTYKHNYKL